MKTIYRIVENKLDLSEIVVSRDELAIMCGGAQLREQGDTVEVLTSSGWEPLAEATDDRADHAERAERLLTGMHLEYAGFQQRWEQLGWADPAWPIVGADGYCTGGVYEGDGSADYELCDWLDGRMVVHDGCSGAAILREVAIEAGLIQEEEQE